MATENTAKLKFLYKDETTRNYDLEVDASLTSSIKEKVVAVNQSLTSGTDNGLSSFFVSNAGASLAKISEAQIISVTETVLDLGGDD